MTLIDFANEMADCRPSSKYYIREILGVTYSYSFYKRAIFDVTGYENNDLQATHACLERHINKKVELINFVRDFREDWGDDGGYCFYVGIYEGKYILGSNYISYNLEYSRAFREINRLEDEDENIEYKYFDSLEEIDAFILRMIEVTKKLKEEDEDWGYESWYLEKEDFESEFMFYCIRNLGSAFVENEEENIQNILNLTKEDIYKPRLFDPIEYYDSWVEKKGLKPVLKV